MLDACHSEAKCCRESRLEVEQHERAVRTENVATRLEAYKSATSLLKEAGLEFSPFDVLNLSYFLAYGSSEDGPENKDDD